MLRALSFNGVDTVFGYPGGAIMPLYDAMLDSNIRHILTRHEQGAIFAANGFARATGRVGVCVATSGPGATNILTGLADAHLDSVPLVTITGQVASSVLGTDAFQEVDVVGMTLPIVKHSYLLQDPDDIEFIVHEAFTIAHSGRPGPVLIDLPKDVASALCRDSDLTSKRTRPVVAPTYSKTVDADTAESLRAMIERAERPVFYIGGGICHADAYERFRRVAGQLAIPVVSTLKGLGIMPADHPIFLGMLGMHGTSAANDAVQQCDLLICLGARFDDRATGKLDAFAPHAKVIHCDIDKAELGKLRQTELKIHADVRDLLVHLERVESSCHQWTLRCEQKKKDDAFEYRSDGLHIDAPRLLARLSALGGPKLTVCCDVGQHQMWVAQHCEFHAPRQHLSSSGLGAMGFGLPAAIGAKLARPDQQVVCVSGDGSILMNIQELATLRRYDIAVKIIVMDNQSLGLVRQWQDLFYEERFSEIDLSDNPDFVLVAKSFGIDGFRVDTNDGVESAISRLLDHDGPCLLHVPVDAQAAVWPLVPPNRPNSVMLKGKPR